MTRGPGRHSERNFRAAEQHYNAALLLLLLLLPHPSRKICHGNNVSVPAPVHGPSTGECSRLPKHNVHRMSRRFSR